MPKTPAPLLELEPEPEPEAEPELEAEPEAEPEIDPEADPGPLPASELEDGPPLATGLMQILPADFKLPNLIKFVPNPQLKVDLDVAIAYAIGLVISEKAGCERADVALTEVRTRLKAIADEFEEPTEIAYSLHKRLTTLRGEWTAPGAAAVKNVGQRVALELRRLDAIEQEKRRKEQQLADQRERERIAAEAKRAEAAKAPAPVVEALRQQAKTATAAPVPATAAAAPVLRGSTAVAPWKARIVGTPACDEPNPDMKDLTPTQRLEVFKLLQGILDGRDPINAVALDWSYINGRARADRATFRLSGFEAWEDAGLRSKGLRAR